jgi:hypothetical protein
MGLKLTLILKTTVLYSLVTVKTSIAGVAQAV